jgi:hypothetical protein
VQVIIDARQSVEGAYWLGILGRNDRRAGE